MGGTIKYTDRFINLTTGRSASAFANNATVPARQFIVPVEYGQLFDIFNKATRAGVQNLFAQGGPTLQQAAKPFHAALPLAPPVLDQGAAVFKDLGYDQLALSTLVSSTAQVSDAVASSNPGVQTLIQGAANTFRIVGAEGASLRHALASAAYAFHWLGTSLYHAGTVGPATFVHVAELSRRLNPGITELNALAPILVGTLRQLVNVEPTAVDTLLTVKQYGPRISTLLSAARTELLPQVTSISRQGAIELNCIRPYTPDIMNFLDTFGGFGDGLNSPHVHMLHALVSVLPFPNAMPINSAQITQLLPNLHIANPQPPGMGWNQPWYQPQCGSTPSIDTAAGDSENGTFDPSGSKLVPFTTTTPSYFPAPTPRPPVRRLP
jgi:ABC-type transporter Mla subunit MlaD